MNKRTSGDSIGFSGNTTARLAMLTNADFNTKEFLYLDTDLHCLMMYKPSVLQFAQYDGQIIGTNPPSISPTDGQVWIGTERVYTYDSTNKFWKIKLSEYIRKATLSDGQEYSEELNGADIKFIRTGSQYFVSVYQRVNADKIHYAVNDFQDSALLDTMQSVILIDNLADGITYDISVTLKFNGVQNQYEVVKYDDTIFIISHTTIIAPTSAYMTMSTFERSLFKKNGYTSTKLIYDVDLETFMLWDGTAFFRFGGQPEKTVFPSVGYDGQVITGTSKIKYTYVAYLDFWNCDFIATKDVAGLISASDKDKLDKLVASPKDNLIATTSPTVTDDTKAGYSAGSTWVYNSVTYTCTDATEGKAKWVSSADIFYTDTWDSLVALISVSGTTYVGKYFTVTNANGGASSGATHIAPSSVTNPIVDGGSATYLINAQGSTYSVTCLKRTITNPIISSVMLVPTSKSTNAGYYIFAVNPSDGLPSGVAVNDICYFDGATWSKFQSYATAPTVITVGSTMYNQTSWRKFQGSWMNTADEYNPDGFEYQTGKLWNGKPIYRKCWESTTPAGGSTKTFGSIPTTGRVILSMATVFTNTNYYYTFTLCTQINTAVTSTGSVQMYTYDGNYGNRPVVYWVEYTKS